MISCPFDLYVFARGYAFEPYGLVNRMECIYLKLLAGFSPLTDLLRLKFYGIL